MLVENHSDALITIAQLPPSPILKVHFLRIAV
jgi:hypothetical protein